jgi:hypothetical protein
MSNINLISIERIEKTIYLIPNACLRRVRAQ